MNQSDELPRGDLDKMRYFTPELLLQLNSSDDKSVERATRKWEKVSAEYKKVVRDVGRELPTQSRRILDLSLHDWKLVTIKSGRGGRTRGTSGTMIMVLEYRSELTVLFYALTQRLRRLDPPEGWSLSVNENVYWLYDEVDYNANDPDSFLHRILFSDGTTLLIPFASCEVAQVMMDHSMSHADLKKIA